MTGLYPRRPIQLKTVRAVSHGRNGGVKRNDHGDCPGPKPRGVAARKVGYSAMIRLSKQRQTAPEGSVLRRAPRTGEWSYRKPD